MTSKTSYRVETDLANVGHGEKVYRVARGKISLPNEPWVDELVASGIITPDETPEEKESGSVPIDKVVTGYSTLQALKRAGVETVGDVQGLSDDDLLKIPGIGESKLKQIRTQVQKWTTRQ